MLEHDLVREAQELAKSDAVQEIFRRLEAEYVQNWKNSAPDKPDLREHAFRMVLALDALRTEINTLAQSERVKAWNRRNIAADTTLR